MLNSLPAELVELVVEYSDDDTLRALCTVSIALSYVAERYLYRKLDVKHATACAALCNILQCSSSKAAAARELILIFETTDATSDALWNTIAPTLALLTNLTALHLALPVGAARILHPTLLLPRLRTLSAVLPLDNALTTFLERHPLISLLCIGPSSCSSENIAPTSFVLAPEALPNLTAYMGSLPLALQIVPGRPVSTLTLAWPMGGVGVVDAIRVLAKGSTVPVRQFECTMLGRADRKAILEALAAHMPSLRLLRINSVLCGASQEEKFAKMVADAVESFKDLHRLDLPSLVYANDDLSEEDADADGELQVVGQWKTHCPSLEVVTLPSCITWRLACKGQQDLVWRREQNDDTGGTLLITGPLI